MNSKIILACILLTITGLIVTGSVMDSVVNPTPTFAVDNSKEVSAGVDISDRLVEGQLSGFDCAVVGEYCPTTHRGADYTVGVFNKEEGGFYFIVNIPQNFLQQYFRNTVEVNGNSYNPYDHAVEPETIQVIESGERRLVYESGYFIDENGNRATFQDGVFKNGKWIVTE